MARRGRPSKGLGPVVTTTVRVPVDEWKWVKESGAEFSAILRKGIRREMDLEEERAALLEFRARRDREVGTPLGKLKDWIVEQGRQGVPITVEMLAAKKAELGL